MNSISYIKLRRKIQPFVYRTFGNNSLEDWSVRQKLTVSMIQFAADKVNGSVQIYLYPRRMVREVWNHEMEGQPFTLKKYAFRAFARGNMIVIFDDATETKDSLLWLLLHEIAHIFVTRTPKLRRQFRSKSLPSGYMTSDSAHESAPEEQFANMMADGWYKEFSGHSGSFHRLWWRDRVLKKTKNSPVVFKL
jgi:hypothetical protein